MTRLAVLSDIHGNADALTAVLADILTFSPDLFINLGDVFSGPLDPARTAELLDGMPNLTILGNHDRWLLDPQRRTKGWEAVTWPKLDRMTLGWLAGLPTGLVIEDVLACHGTPVDDTTYWLEQIGENGDLRRAETDWIAAQIQDRPQAVFLCGHTHIPRVVRLGGGQMVINPGSVGLPAYSDLVPRPHRACAGVPHASYMILDKRGQDWAVTHRLVPYDASRMIALAQSAGADDWVSALGTGWVCLPDQAPNRR